MGILYHDAKMLWEARLSGASFERVATIGHLRLSLHPSEVKALRAAYRVRMPASVEAPLQGYRFGEFADRFCREFLGAAEIRTIDYSDYEGATITHDMNKPVPEDLRGRFDAVIEAGSLEHIFNFPVAIENLMRMAKVGGNVFLTTVANNLCGHGFYQFSPELMYRVFSRANGFELKRVVLLEAGFRSVESTPIRRAYAVADPLTVGGRVGLVSKRPVMMMVEARKLENLEPFATTPQQSDYVVEWNQEAAPPSAGLAAALRRIVKTLPMSWRSRLKGHYENWQFSPRNKRFYKKLA